MLQMTPEMLENIREDDLRILGKGGKERVVPLGKKAAHHLFRYLNGERRRIMKRAHPGQDAVFLSRTGARLGRLDQRAVAAMDPVKITDGEDRATQRRGCGRIALDNECRRRLRCIDHQMSFALTGG